MPGPLEPGLHETLVTAEIARVLSELEGRGFHVERAALDGAEAHERLAWHLYAVLRRRLRALPARERLERQAELTNSLLEQIGAAGARVELPPELLRAIASPDARLPDGSYAVPEPPGVPLIDSDLLVNAPGEPSIGHALTREIASADAIDLVCAFIRWNGVRILLPAIEAFRAAGRPLRVLTTTYLGATQRCALDALARCGAAIRISYEALSTRLHAKAWLLRRASGFSTAYVGSSNLSYSALHDGIEWNVRLSAVRNGDVIEKFAAAFESLWEDPAFAPYEPGRDRERLDRALEAAREGSSGAAGTSPEGWLPAALDVRPYPHQEEILADLEAARGRHDRHRNLVVAATGTGKTVIAALDYRRLCGLDEREMVGGSAPRPRLLFVAHREEILRQSLGTFRAVLRDGAFGELHVGGEIPDEWEHVFASIQSLSRLPEGAIPPERYDVVIVDEFHHAAAATYDRLLQHLRPRELLGLTATPERADGRSVLHWFDDRIASEMRLWEALDRQLLVPFHYFGIHDNVDLSHVRWRRGGYDTAELERIYTADDARVRLVLEQIGRLVDSPRAMRALGFCVSIAHAEYMADRFARAGIPALAVSTRSRARDRREALAALRNREVNAIFAVDLFNEGVDLPEIDTVLFLRPTESATVFIQQLGRGLRHSPGTGKSCLTVLDFIGNAHRRFRFDLRYRALTGETPAGTRRAIAGGFPHLPAGCSLHLDRVAREVVLENLKQAIGARRASLVEELRSLEENVSLAEFLRRTGVEVEDLYRGSPGWSWTAIRRAAGLPCPAEGPDEARIERGLARILHVDDPERIAFLLRLLRRDESSEAADLSERERRMALGFLFALLGHAPRGASVGERIARLGQHPAIVSELLELLEILDDRAPRAVVPLHGVLPWKHPVPLSVHARYSLDEILTAFALMTVERPHSIREGVAYDRTTRSDLLFVTLEKTEKQYSPTTLYRDHAISPELFHWESQSTTSADSPTARRYIEPAPAGSHVFLFVRRCKREGGRTVPYTFLGPARHVHHEGSRPVAIVWKLARPMPPDLFATAKAVAG